MTRRTPGALVAAALIAATLGCETDVGPRADLAFESIVPLSQASYEITLRNTGDLRGALIGCDGSPTTFVQRWNGEAWIDDEPLHDDCLLDDSWDWTLEPGATYDYAATVQEGRFRFAVTMLVGDDIVETGWSDGVGVGVPQAIGYASSR